ncbi:uncharacterized protein LOC129284519 [Prosopis cineraria]|uniref:uncharacterized protein LOC129284519 n=1 Tax=Prosopis cineraria TaxID=364024 RepID=UPI00240F5AEC|nr:uncharacterized protein LOC129284519 [Prosopis cineraria]
MAWLARSIANSLRLDDDDEKEDKTRNVDPNINHGGDQKSPLKPESESVQSDSQSSSPASTPSAQGVKDDLSELTKSISRQFWGVASFLAPPPESPPPQTQISAPNPDEPNGQSSDHSYSKLSDEDLISGIRSDFAEISGKFKSGISKLSSNKTVSEITKIASNFLQFGSEEERSLEEYELGSVVGVTEEVVAFARNLAMHPETWLDFPLPDDADPDDFELSDAQQEHALAVERLAPRLAALRMELCPGYMSDGCFWKIYFVLLRPRLNKQDAELLSSPEIVEARAMLTIKLDEIRKEKQEPDLSARGAACSKEEEEQHLSVPSDAQLKSEPVQASVVEAALSLAMSDVEMEKHPVQSTEIEVIDKSVVEEAPAKPSVQQPSSTSANKFSDNTEDEADDWLNEDNSEIAGVSGTSMIPANDDDVSFSDLEEDDGDVPVSYKKVTSGSDSSTKDSRDWVQLGRSSLNSDKDIGSVESRGSEHARTRNPESKDSNDWLNVDDIDVM